MGIGTATGENRALEAARKAISSPLLEDVSVEGAMGILVNVTGGPSLTLHEVNSAIELITDAAHEDANIIFGYVVDPTKDEEVSITVIATGFEQSKSQKKPEQQYQTIVPSYSNHMNNHLSREVPTFIRQGYAKKDSLESNITSYSNYPRNSTQVPPTMPVKNKIPILDPIEDSNYSSTDTLVNKKDDEYDIPAFLRRDDR